jgi:lipid II:glycine glycyltransferase (peptidoglycan interpeptide bridge formation enzyme)
MTFFQSRAFGELQEKIPYRGKTWRISGGCLVVRIKMRFGFSWLWAPYAPPFKQPAFAELAKIAKEERAIFARVEPFRPGAEFDSLKSRWRIIKSPRRFTPEHTLVLDLTQSEEEILAQMKSKGRYNIQVAKKHSIQIWNSGYQSVPGNTKVQLSPLNVKHHAADLDAFYKLLQKTGSRDDFGIHPKFFYETLLKTFGESSSLFLAKHGSTREVIGGIIVIYYKDTATYYYGASSYEHRNLMVPYLLQWEAIREAKRRAMKIYDFLGIAPPNVKNHPWAGVTEFKKKFGGREITYPPAFDVVYRPLLYRAMRLAQSYRQ